MSDPRNMAHLKPSDIFGIKWKYLERFFFYYLDSFKTFLNIWNYHEIFGQFWKCPVKCINDVWSIVIALIRPTGCPNCPSVVHHGHHGATNWFHICSRVVAKDGEATRCLTSLIGRAPLTSIKNSAKNQPLSRKVTILWRRPSDESNLFI